MPLWNSSNNEKNTKTEEKLKLEKRKFLPVFIPHFSQRSRGGKDKKILLTVGAFREEDFSPNRATILAHTTGTRNGEEMREARDGKLKSLPMEILDRRSAQGSSIKNIFHSRNSFMTEAFLSVLMSTLLRWTESNGINKCSALCVVLIVHEWNSALKPLDWLWKAGGGDGGSRSMHWVCLPSLPKPPIPQFVTTRLTLGNYYCGRLKANLWNFRSFFI